MKNLFKNPYFLGIVLILIFVLLFSLNTKFRKAASVAVPALGEVISGRLESLESLPDDSEWKAAIDQKARESSITYREQALRDIAFILQNSYLQNGKRMYTDKEIRDEIFKLYKVQTLTVST